MDLGVSVELAIGITHRLKIRSTQTQSRSLMMLSETSCREVQ